MSFEFLLGDVLKGSTFWMPCSKATICLPPFLTFVLVFTLWSLYTVAGEFDNPFDGGGVNDLDLDLVQCEVNAQLMTLLQGPSLRPPKLRKSGEEASRRLIFQARGSSFDKNTYFTTQTRNNAGKEWNYVVHRALSEKRTSGVLSPSHTKNVAMSAFFSSEVSNEESSEQDDLCDLDPSENFHTHVIRSDRQQRRRAKVRSVQKVDKQKFDNASSEEDILLSSAASSATSFWARGISAASCRSCAPSPISEQHDRDSSCHSHAASPTTVTCDLTSDPLTDEIVKRLCGRGCADCGASYESFI